MPTYSAAAVGYRPRTASNQLKEIVEDSKEKLSRCGPTASAIHTAPSPPLANP